MKRLVIFCCSVLALWSLAARAAFAEPDPIAQVEQAYQDARHCYYEILADAQRVQQRQAWDQCLAKFVRVAQQYPQSPRSADANFTAAKLYEQLYQISKSREDLTAAKDRYRAFAKRHRKHRLADDALYRAAVVAWEGFHQKGEAGRLLWQVTHWHRDGDMQTPATQFITQLEKIEGKTYKPIASLLPLPKNTPAQQSPAVTPPTKAPVAAATTHTTPTPSAAVVAGTAPATNNMHIIVDAGHGGTDPGAHGPGGTWEKDVTLAIAKRLGAQLKQQLGCKVTYTRTSDKFVSLEARNKIANQRRADLFISIHANAAPNVKAAGIETYYLNNATDQAAKRLADRENAAVAGNGSELERIVSTMLQNAFTEGSHDLATQVQRALVQRLRRDYKDTKDLGVRSALFYVLVGAKSPAILVETSFLSNPTEEQRLRDPKYQTAITAAIADGVAQFLRAAPARSTL
ncbi:MAG: N-acetylmuramoyl-L-alanine amidase [Deltaproteobacteria bacterium]|nr:N-acetylmuramoyl-L-alanine amidase [Deltaproteobacteria bacterium]